MRAVCFVGVGTKRPRVVQLLWRAPRRPHPFPVGALRARPRIKPATRMNSQARSGQHWILRRSEHDHVCAGQGAVPGRWQVKNSNLGRHTPTNLQNVICDASTSVYGHRGWLGARIGREPPSSDTELAADLFARCLFASRLPFRLIRDRSRASASYREDVPAQVMDGGDR
jgi:hypothetical protein